MVNFDIIGRSSKHHKLTHPLQKRKKKQKKTHEYSYYTVFKYNSNLIALCRFDYIARVPSICKQLYLFANSF